MKKFLIGICIVCMLLLPSTNALNVLNSEIKDLNFDNNLYVEPDKFLTSYPFWIRKRVARYPLKPTSQKT